MLKKSLLTLCLSAGGLLLMAQSADMKLEQLKQQVDLSGQREGRKTALGLAILGADYLNGDKAEMDRLIYETYYSTPSYDEYEEGYAELTFNAADWSPNGNQLAVAMSDGNIRIYDANNFSSYEEIAINDMGVLDVSWSPNGNFLAYGGVNGEAGYLSTSSWEEVYEWEEGDYIRAVAFSPDSKRIAAGGDENILYIYNLNSKEQERAFASHTDWIRGVSWSADGTKVAAASDDNTATVWSLTQGNLIKTHRDHEDYCRNLAFSPKGNMLATVSDDLNVYVYDPASSNVPGRSLKGHEEWVMAVDWSSDGRLLATVDNGGGIIVHNLKKEDQTFYNSVEESTAWLDVDFSKNNDQLAVTSGYELAIYTLGQSTPTQRLTPDGVSDATTASGEVSEDKLEELLSTLLTGATGIEPSADKAKMAIINESYQVDVVDMSAGSLIYTIDGHDDWVRNISWSSDGRLIATASDDQMVGVWDAATGEMQQLLSGHSDWVRDVAFSPDNKVLASAGDDGVLRFWDTDTGDELSSTENIGSYLMTVNWSPDQAYLAAESSENQLYIWNAKNNELIFTSSTDVMQGSAKWVGNKQLEVNGMEGQLFSWSGGDELEKSTGSMGLEATSASGKKATVVGPYIAISGAKNLLEGHNGMVTALEFSPDGKYLVSQSTEGEVGLWDVNTGNRMALISATDGIIKPLWWSKDGSGFYIPGASGKVQLPTAGLRAKLTTADYQEVFSEDAIRRYQLDKIFLSDASVVEKLKANANPAFLENIAAYYEQRAAAAKVASINSEDAAKAKAFQLAADR